MSDYDRLFAEFDKFDPLFGIYAESMRVYLESLDAMRLAEAIGDLRTVHTLGEYMPEYSERELLDRLNARLKGETKPNRRQRRAAKATR